MDPGGCVRLLQARQQTQPVRDGQISRTYVTHAQLRNTGFIRNSQTYANGSYAVHAESQRTAVLPVDTVGGGGACVCVL